mmetsp:Transcript_12292/g.16589  ORF Transcript_12292/g.16589 Transcript_12292/m.16589 type:complete len:508 (-) Transcript_12292:1803-3326(-)
MRCFVFVFVLVVLFVDEVGGSVITHPKSQLDGGKIVLTGLVISGHKGGKSGENFVRQSSCAAKAMIWSAMHIGRFQGDVIIMSGPLGPESPHDKMSWKRIKDNNREEGGGWLKVHRKLIRLLSLAINENRSEEKMIIKIWDLVPMLLSEKYLAMKFNLNYMKLAVYELPYEQALFIDLDIIIIGSLKPFFNTVSISVIENNNKKKRVELAGYRTCTAPVNSGFFLVFPLRDSRLLIELNSIILRNQCPCRIDSSPSSSSKFISNGYDNFGSTFQHICSLWRQEESRGDTHSSKIKKLNQRYTGLCSTILHSMQNTSWTFAGAGTGQGLMWYYYGIKRKSYLSFTYAQLPFIHYNLPGPKPWSSPKSKTPAIPSTASLPASSNPSLRQHCDFVWWYAVLRAAHDDSFFKKSCLNNYWDSLLRVRLSAQHFPDPACCRTCPGGGHFATSQLCDSSIGLNDYSVTQCKPKAEISDISNVLSLSSISGSTYHQPSSSSSSFFRYINVSYIS